MKYKAVSTTINLPAKTQFDTLVDKHLNPNMTHLLDLTSYEFAVLNLILRSVSGDPELSVRKYITDFLDKIQEIYPELIKDLDINHKQFIDGVIEGKIYS